MCGTVLSLRPRSSTISLWNADWENQVTIQDTQKEICHLLQIDASIVRYEVHGPPLSVSGGFGLRIECSVPPSPVTPPNKPVGPNFAEQDDFQTPFLELDKPLKDSPVKKPDPTPETKPRLNLGPSHRRSYSYDPSGVPQITHTSPSGKREEHKPSDIQRTKSCGNLLLSGEHTVSRLSLSADGVGPLPKKNRRRGKRSTDSGDPETRKKALDIPDVSSPLQTPGPDSPATAPATEQIQTTYTFSPSRHKKNPSGGGPSIVIKTVPRGPKLNTPNGNFLGISQFHWSAFFLFVGILVLMGMFSSSEAKHPVQHTY